MTASKTAGEGYLTTHVLDTARGLPAKGIAITLYRISDNSNRKITTAVTNHDGRTDSPILPKGKMSAGQYELVFAVGDYIKANKLHGAADEPLFLNEIPIRFGINDESSHYHVPLLLSPFGYSTYRGS